MPMHKVMDHTGHSTFEFNQKNKAELAVAEERFHELVGQGFTPAELRGDKQVVNREFNPSADVVFYPRLQGG